MTTQTSAATAAFITWAVDQELTPSQYETLNAVFIHTTSVVNVCVADEPLFELFRLTLASARPADKKFQTFVADLKAKAGAEVTRMLEARVAEIKEWERM